MVVEPAASRYMSVQKESNINLLLKKKIKWKLPIQNSKANV